MEKPLVLFVDDDKRLLDGIARNLRNKPFDIMTVTSADYAMELMKRRQVHVVISDDSMKGMTGTEFLCWVAKWYPNVVRIMLTGQPNVPGMQKLMNEAGVFRFLLKPVNDVDLSMNIFDALDHAGIKWQTNAQI